MRDNELEMIEILESMVRIISAYYNKKMNGDESTDIPLNLNSYNFSLHRHCFCGKENCSLCNTPNFYYKPYGLEVYWYKYLGRGMFVNSNKKDLKICELYNMMNHCIMEIENMKYRYDMENGGHKWNG